MAFCSKFNKCFRWFKSKINTVLINNIDACIKVTTNLKTLIDSPGAITLVELTSVKWDNYTRTAISAALAYALKAMGFIKDIKDVSDSAVTDFKDHLSQMSKDERNAKLIKVASLMTAHVDGFKEKQHFYDSATQFTYTMNKTA